MVREDEKQPEDLKFLNPPMTDTFNDVDHLGPGTLGRRLLTASMGLVVAGILFVKCSPSLDASCKVICYSMGAEVTGIDREHRKCYCFGEKPMAEDLPLP